jgi:circadian clock protein KaiB
MPEETAGTRTLRLRLYILSGAPSSNAALTNLDAIAQAHPGTRYDLEVVDVRDEPLRALSEGALVVPTLILISGTGNRALVGDLSDTAKVLHVLGIHPADPAGPQKES